MEKDKIIESLESRLSDLDEERQKIMDRLIQLEEEELKEKFHVNDCFIIFCVRKPQGLQPRGGITPSIFIIIIHLNLLLFNIIYYLYIGNSPNELTKQRNYDI